MYQKLLTQANRKALPALYATEDIPVKEKKIIVKFFTPWNYWTWFGVEFDGEDTFYGLVDGHEKEWGYFSLSELESIRGPGGLKIERDMYFGTPTIADIS